MLVQANDFYGAWSQLLRLVMEKGHECQPRGLKIKELLHTQLVVNDLRRNVLVHPVRDLNYRFMVAEWQWVFHGSDDLAFLTRYNKEMAKFSDDGETLHGAYGKRLMPQWDQLLGLLRRDPDTRQAIATIFDYKDLRPIGFDIDGKLRYTKDCPCTLTLQLLLRAGRLHGVVTMRSNDLWLGLPYDFFTFSQLVNGLAGQLGVETGSLTLQAGSSHVYEPHFKLTLDVLSQPHLGRTVRSPALPSPEYQRVLDCLGKNEALKLLEELSR